MALNITPEGLMLLQRAIAGQAEVVFVNIQYGNGNDAGDDADSLNNPLMTLPITVIDIGESFVTLHAAYSNADVSAPFRATELGVWAEDPDAEGEKLLYAYGYTETDKADYIPARDERILEAALEIMLYIGEAENVTAAISQSINYVTQEEYEAYLRREDNPHKVTKEQIGLGQVPNVTTNDQRPEYVESETLEAPESGETLKVTMGKLRTAVQSLISHLSNRNNPHEVSCRQIGAAAADHTHSTNDMNAGTLSIERGGTGVNTAAKLAALVAQNMPDGAITTQQLAGGAVTPEKASGLQKQHKALSVIVPAISGGSTQTVNLTGVTESNTVLVVPSPESFLLWRESGVRCTAQGAGTLTFAAEESTGESVTANVLILD